MPEYKVNVVTLDNGKDYQIVKDVTIDDKRYCYLVNVDNNKDICVRIVKAIDGELGFSYLTSEEEFNKVMEHFLETF